ncbi:uncharacterized protein BJ212DRAFT_1323206 [Suillus subaureus]|uniref:Uncharacterized protein n=1 Tax=Suillus subaureus TaxID=48587 RepID=A0A9P7EL89_9AGAM|nr:uncharacterized protein BJ212DRAFT_1323206 [Suillus subaureus]KAG1824910.1 hypothetical protein BJ212DRAFT_1323206 [Suillus subaureus]
MQTSSHDRSIESEGCQRAQSFSCCDEPETTLSAQVCLPLARSDSDSPPSIDENRVAIPAVSQTTSMGELTSAVPCRETLVAEECVPLSTVTCTPSSPPLGRQSSQTISCNDSPATDEKLHRECAESSVLVCASVALEENDKSTPTRSNVSHDVRNSSSNESTLTIAESLPLTADRHEEPYSQDVSGYRPSEVSSTPKLESGEEDVSIDHKRQTVEGREDHQEKGTESEVKSNITPCSHTVRIVEGYTSKCVILNDDRQMNEGVDGTILSPSSINPGSKISPSELDVLRDSGANHIESRYEHWSSDVDTVSKSSVQISGHDSTESSEGHIHRQSREEVDSSVLVRVSLAPAETIGTPAPAPCRAVENTQKSSLASNDPNNSSLPEGTTLNDCVEHDKVPVSADCMQEDLECRGDYHAWEAENEVTLKSESYSSAIESLRKSESATVLKASGRSDVDTDSDISSLSSTYTGRQLSLSEPGVPQDAGISRIQSAREHQSSDININSTTLVQTSSQRSIENRVRGSLVTVQGEPCGQDVATGQPCQRFSAPKLDSNELAECTYQTVENGGGRHELETESEFKLSSTAHFHSVEIVERSTSETVVLKVDRKADEDIDVPALPSSPMTTLPPSDLGISQGAGAHLIQSRCEHQSSEVDTASVALVQTSSCDCSTECKGTQRAQSFSCCDEPKATLSGHVCLSLARSDSDSPPSMDKAVENVQESSPVSNRIWKSSFTMTTGQSHSPVANIHKAPCGQDMTKDQPNRGSCSSEHEADEEGVTADHMYQAVMVLRCECQSSEVNEVSKTSESEHTWSRHSSESGEWHTERQGRQQVHSSGIVILQVGESNTTPSQFSGIGVKNAQTSSPTPDDLRNSPMPEGTSTIGQTSPAGDCLQGAPDHDVMGNRYNSRSSSIRKFEDHKVDVTVGCVHQASVTRGDYHEREMESEVEQNLAYHSCSVEMLGQSTSDAVTRNDDRRIDKDADDTALPLSSTTVRPGLSISEPDIPQDAATSSSVITVLTTSMQTSSHSSTVSSEHVRQQPAQTPPCSNELPVDYKVNQSQTTAPVHPFMGRGENNPTSAQPFCVASENTQQPSPASNNIRSSSLPEGASTTGQTSSPATHECGEPWGQDGAKDLPGQGSSTPRLKDDKEVISADSTCQVMEDTSYYRSDTTDGREKESRVDAKVAMLTSSSPNPGPKGSHSEPSVPQDAATNHVQSEREHHITE